MIKNRIKLIAKCLLCVTAVFSSINCKSSGNTAPPLTGVRVIVKSSIDSSPVNGANVVMYNAGSGEAVMRSSSDMDGMTDFTGITEGSYYVRIAAQGFKELPQSNVTPVPFEVTKWQITDQTYYLDTLVGTFGKIDGTLNPALPGFLVVAASVPESIELHSYSGPDGYFALFNVPFGTYQLYAVKSGYSSQNVPEITLTPGSPDATVQLNLNQVQGSTLTGMVTFLAVVNGIVDVSLLDRNSMSVVGGLTAMIDSSRNYTITNIPPGEYKAWASYENDGYVMDPDWNFKNPGALDITFTSDTVATIDFSVTSAISIVFPTNPDDAIIPAEADSTVPLFMWNQYPQAKEYIIEVRDINGNLIWGGFDENGIIRHAQISRAVTSIRFNFDNSAIGQLQTGQIYQWKIYADGDAAPNVQTLLSSSEDLKGIFIVP
jgi:hypothetical protein